MENDWKCIQVQADVINPGGAISAILGARFFVVPGSVANNGEVCLAHRHVDNARPECVECSFERLIATYVSR